MGFAWAVRVAQLAHQQGPAQSRHSRLAAFAPVSFQTPTIVCVSLRGSAHSGCAERAAPCLIVRVLDSLDLSSLLTLPPTISAECGFEKPDARIFRTACERAGVEANEGVIMVGDELVA